MDLMITYPYNVTEAAVPMSNNWIGGFAAISEDSCPLSLDSNGNMKSSVSSEGLIPSSFETIGDGTISIDAHGSHAGAYHNATNKVSFTDVVGFSTSFWVANVIDSYLSFWTLSGALSKLSASGKSWYTTDGGFVDTTGIVNLLLKKKSRIVAFYNNNQDLTEITSPISYLFGVNGNSNAENNIEGPAFNKVFPSDLYNEVSSNLTTSATGVAILRDVPVLANDFFGVEAYTLDELIIIISNPVSQEVFMNQFEDKERISAALDSRFPTYFQVSLPDLDANVLCLYEQWDATIK